MKRLISIILMAALLSLCLTGCGDTRENAAKVLFNSKSRFGTENMRN